MKTEQSPSYRIYLLTVWVDERDDVADPQRWRFRLEEPKTQQRQGYVGLGALMAGLIDMVVRPAVSAESAAGDE